jgi:hypothetical protein
MTSTIALRCRCGAVSGEVSEVSPATCNHAVCYCRDCRAFAHFLDVDILDGYGGTDIVQFAPSRIRITAGHEHMRSMRLTPKGLLRWYAECCRTPIGNMLSIKVPFVGLPRVCLPDVRDDLVGPAPGVQGHLAPGGTPPGAHARAPLGYIARAFALMFRWWVGGHGRPSAYFHDDGTPRVVPEVLAPEERERLRTLDARVGTSAAK